MHPLLDEFERSCATWPQRITASDQSLTLDYQSFRAVAAGLSELIGRESSVERVGIMAPTSTACALAIFAAWYAGKIPIPLNFLLPPEELGKVVKNAEIDLVVTIERFAPAVQSTGLKTLLLNAQSLVPGGAAAPAKQPQDTCVMLYTSGTSGDPKGVCLSFDNVVKNAQSCVKQAGITPDHVILGLLPQFHSFGFTISTVLPLMLGATVHYLPRFSPVAVMNAIAEQRVSILLAIASMYGALLHLKSAGRDSMKSLFLAISGGEPLPQAAADAFEQKYGVKLMEGYGLTETSPVASVNVPGAHRPGSVGKPLPGITIRAVDAAGHDLPPDNDGELLIGGHCVMQGYYKRPAETAAAIVNGELRTGDIGKISPDGFVYITGRAKEMMIIGGENVYPREIESVLEQHPAVAETAAIGIRDEVRGETPVAFVILKEGAKADDAELRDFCRGRIAAFKIPRRIHIAAELPRSPTGKILKRALKEPTGAP